MTKIYYKNNSNFIELNYTNIKAAPLQHSHEITDIIGPLPIIQGGTGVSRTANTDTSVGIYFKNKSKNYLDIIPISNGVFGYHNKNQDPSFQILPITNGGTGLNDADLVRDYFKTVITNTKQEKIIDYNNTFIKDAVLTNIMKRIVFYVYLPYHLASNVEFELSLYPRIFSTYTITNKNQSSAVLFPGSNKITSSNSNITNFIGFSNIFKSGETKETPLYTYKADGTKISNESSGIVTVQSTCLGQIGPLFKNSEETSEGTSEESSEGTLEESSEETSKNEYAIQPGNIIRIAINTSSELAFYNETWANNRPVLLLFNTLNLDKNINNQLKIISNKNIT